MKIILDNNDLLKKKCLNVDLKTGFKIAKRMGIFLNKLKKKTKSKIAGLAANQVGIDACVSIVLKNNKPFVLINPKIVSFSDVRIRNKERCLSYPDIELDVYRHMWVQVSCDNHKETIFFGNVSLESDLIKNFESAVVQHEICHLNGLTFHDFQWNNSPTPKEW
jgi:peptide deformylase